MAQTPDQWYHVEGTMNPGDHTSRGISADSLLNCEKWLLGPEFLWNPMHHWIKELGASIAIQDEDPEVKPNPVVEFNEKLSAAAAVVVLPILSDYFQRFSCWYPLKKSFAWILRYRNNLLMAAKSRKGSAQPKTLQEKHSPITLEEMENAEKATLKNVQQEAFPEEFNELNKFSGSKRVKRSSCLFKLDPILEDGLLRVGGRLARARFSYNAMHQLILAKKNHVSSLTIDYFHKLSGHLGRHVLSMIRQKYWIIQGNSMVGRVLTSCYSCRRQEAPFCQLKMADLPNDRLVPDKPPFTTVGVDCFGPFQVRRSRSLVKRFGVIFTCLTVRAVRIEVAHSLDTDSFLLALRGFIPRKGQVKEIRSDNGSNFTSGERELSESIQAWNQDKISDEMLQRNVKWNFNPPCGSHH
ncbi:uncharacterized protein LOC111328047 [Stylophora pistillata]|uniref:uncharacterized protein LOC111328047 n=1 Tax=Stylophora pistillata TaxID=50429 RepID=UPI000C041242|nr:uncharacterized protein LOC111328047 [Stylophora pistillata]